MHDKFSLGNFNRILLCRTLSMLSTVDIASLADQVAQNQLHHSLNTVDVEAPYAVNKQ